MDLRELAAAEASALVDRLTAAMAVEIEAATRRAQTANDAAAEKARDEANQLRAALAKARTDEKTLQTALEKLRADEKTLKGTVEKLRAEHTSLHATVERYRADEKTRQSTIDKLQESERTLQATVDTLQAAERGHQAELAQAAAGCTLAEAELKSVRAEREAIADEMQRAEAAWIEQTRSVREQVLNIASGPLDELRTAFQRLTTAGGVAGVLTVLIEALATEFSRVALFHVNGNHLEGRKQTGFDFASDISKVSVPLTKGSPLSEAVRSGRVQGLTAAELTDSSRQLFGGAPSFVLILPVAVAGRIEAIVYADNSDQPHPQFASTKRGVHFAEILLTHAVPLLARLSAEEKALAELRDYCAQLLKDLESVYAGDASAGHRGEKLQRRLRHNLEYARNMYAQRAGTGPSAGARLFDDEIAALIGGRHGSAFAADLAAVATPAPDTHGKVSAEAS